MTDWSRYAAYLQSPEWWKRRDAIMLRADWRCEIENCRRSAHEVHHLTYDRLYREEPTDLIALCVACHDTLTNLEGKVGIGCLGSPLARELGDPCFCPVCELQRKATTLARRMRKQFVKDLNRDLHERLLMRYGASPQPKTRYAGISRRNDLPSAMICRRTGEPANTPSACGSCDACLWVAALESEYRDEEEGPSDE